jgi:hypothetical protein
VNVGILDVAPVLAQVRGDPVDADLLAEARRLDGIRLVAAPGLPQRRDMIDVHVEPLVRGDVPTAGG